MYPARLQFKSICVNNHNCVLFHSNYSKGTLTALFLFSFNQCYVTLYPVKCLESPHLTFFLRHSGFFIPSLLLRRATVSLFLKDVADEDAQQAHDAEHGHQSKHGVLCGLLLRGAYNRTVHRCSGATGRPVTHSANPSLQSH